MADFRQKLKMMSSLSADWNKPSEKPVVCEKTLDDTETVFPYDTVYGRYGLEMFRDVSARLFYGLNDLPEEPLDPERLLFLDTETTGLFGAAVQAFLVGLGYFRKDGFHVRQLLMRSLGAEEELLNALRDLFPSFDTVVTFNGKSFDIPLLETRMVFHRIRAEFPKTHIDLIHPARRIYKLRLESCRLSNLEARVFGVERIDDLDGSLIPGRYFQFTRTGDDALLTDILDHNRQDIVSMPLLVCAMCQALSGPTEAQPDADLFSIGRYYMRQKNADTAADYFSNVPDGLWALPAQWHRSLILKKTDPAAAAACWEEILARTPDYCPAMIELSKYHEHTTRDISAAYSYCLQALDTNMGKYKYAGELSARKARLEKKLFRSRNAKEDDPRK